MKPEPNKTVKNLVSLINCFLGCLGKLKEMFLAMNFDDRSLSQRKWRWLRALASVNPFAPEPKVNTPCTKFHVSSTACDIISFNSQGQFNFEHDSVKEAWQKGKKPWKLIDKKITMKILFTPLPPFLPFNPNMILKAFPKTSHPNKLKEKTKPRTVKRKKLRLLYMSLLNPKAISKFSFMCMPELTDTNILHLDQKTMKYMTCKWLCGKF